jgi:universal stress protein E
VAAARGIGIHAYERAGAGIGGALVNRFPRVSMRFLVLKNVLVAVDPEHPVHPAILTAARLAGAAGATLHACVVTDSGDDRDEGAQARARSELSAALLRAGVNAKDVTVHVLSGDPAFAIRSLGDRVRADVVVLGPHRERASRSRSFGGTALAVVTNAWSPCLVVSSELRLPLSDVVVPIDLSDTARGALLVGLSWASALRGGSAQPGGAAEARLTALHVQAAAAPTPPSFLEKELAVLRESGGTWAGVTIRGEAVSGSSVPEGIASFVRRQRPDLIVLGTRGLGLDPVGRLGSVAASVAQSTDVPTLLVPPALWMAHASEPPAKVGNTVESRGGS